MKRTKCMWMGMVFGLMMIVSPVNAEFIANGDFGTWESGWGEDNGARFTNSAGNPAWSGVLTVGNSVLWQSISASPAALPANTQYTISIDGVGYDTNVGGLYVAMIYYHTNGTMTSDAVLTIPSANLPTDWTTYTSSAFQTPTDLSYTKIWIAKVSQVGGWVGVDNVKGTVVPEPMTMVLLGVGGLILRKKGS